VTTPTIITPTVLLTHAQPSIANADNILAQAKRAELPAGPEGQEKFDSAIDGIKICNSQIKRADEAMHRLIDPLTEHVKWIREQFKPIFDTFGEAKTIFETKAKDWKRVEDARLAAIAEEERKLAEEQALADAQAAVDAGDAPRAEALLDLAASTPTSETQVRGRGHFTGASGSTKLTWKGEVTDVKALCQAIVDGKIPESFIKEFSKSKLNAYANTTQKEGVFFGIKCFEKDDLYVR
jgi:hypothetical protein